MGRGAPSTSTIQVWIPYSFNPVKDIVSKEWKAAKRGRVFLKNKPNKSFVDSVPEN